MNTQNFTKNESRDITLTTLPSKKMLAVALKTGEMEHFKEYFDKDKQCAVCEVKRKGWELVVEEFSVEDAKRAGLWNSRGPWVTYPKRMLKHRARCFALQDMFADVFDDVISGEEADDYPGHLSVKKIDLHEEMMNAVKEMLGALYADAFKEIVERKLQEQGITDGECEEIFKNGVIAIENELKTAAAAPEPSSIPYTAPSPTPISEEPSLRFQVQNMIAHGVISKEQCDAICKKNGLAGINEIYHNEPLMKKVVNYFKGVK